MGHADPQPSPARGRHHSSFTELPAEPRRRLSSFLSAALSDGPQWIPCTPLCGSSARNQKEGDENTVKSTQALVIIVYFITTAKKKDGKTCFCPSVNFSSCSGGGEIGCFHELPDTGSEDGNRGHPWTHRYLRHRYTLS